MGFMSKYTSSSADWSRYMRNDPSKNYTRNLVADISGRANLVCHRCISPILRSGLTLVVAVSLEPRERITHP
jgi:hypothetical protein